jgi:hypothetical protein
MKIDLVKNDKNYYSAKKTPDLREFNSLKYITILGKGEPAGVAFTNAIEALYPLAYGIRKIYKSQNIVFSVSKLEGLWWVESDQNALDVPRSEWYWKLLIRMPKPVEEQHFIEAKNEVYKKKKIELIKDIQFEELNEGKCVQIMHVGPYSAEPESIQQMKEFMTENSLTEDGLHHEIYISDPRKTEPEKMKTILRQPVS